VYPFFPDSQKQPVNQSFHNLPTVLEGSSQPTHTEARPFCSHPFCLCHANLPRLMQVLYAYVDGELTAQEAMSYLYGRQLVGEVLVWP
jgi:hypothetical protein